MANINVHNYPYSNTSTNLFLNKDGSWQSIDSLISITYNDLKTLRNTNSLKSGLFYRITDYNTTTTQVDTSVAGHQFDIIVQALDSSVLSENVQATYHEGDTYFIDASANLNAWQLKYCIDNDSSKFMWADTTNGTGIIYWMKDEWNNECSYDFKNIMFKRWAITDVSLNNNSSLNMNLINSLKNIFVYNNEELYIKFSYSSSNIINNGNILTVDSDINDYYYTFTYINNGEIIEDATIICLHISNDEGIYVGVHDNIIKSCTNYSFYNYDLDTNIVSYGLNNIVFCSSYTYEGGLFFDGVAGNIFGTECINNTFGNFCLYNTFGNSNSRYTFGNYCLNNTFGNYCGYSTFGNYCGSNMFGNNCHSNTFGNNCLHNTFDNFCFDNMFGNSCLHNTFGNYCGYSTFGNSNSHNTFGNSCLHIKFLKNYSYYIIVESDNQYITLTSTETTSSSNPLRNITIAQGVNNTNINNNNKTISHNTLNDTFKTIYLPLNSQVISI